MLSIKMIICGISCRIHITNSNDNTMNKKSLYLKCYLVVTFCKLYVIFTVFFIERFLFPSKTLFFTKNYDMTCNA